MYKISLKTISNITGIIIYLAGRKDKKNIILCYHDIADDGWEFSVTRRNFIKQLNSLKETRKIVGLSKLLNSKDVSLAAITFDDGYENVFKYALPVMKNMGLTGCVFINDPSMDGLEGRKLMNNKQIKELVKSGWEIGYHTKTHIDCTKASSEELKKELEFVIELENKLKLSIKYFAYPYGRWSKETISILKECGFTHAFTVASGYFNTKNKYLISRTIVANYLSLNDFRALTSDLGIALSVFHSRVFRYSKKILCIK